MGNPKYRVFNEETVKRRIKLDLYNAAIGSIERYGIATMRPTGEMGGITTICIRMSKRNRTSQQ